jgi:hypothetical protein
MKRQEVSKRWAFGLAGGEAVAVGQGLQRLSGLIWFWDGVEQCGGGFGGELAQGGGGPRELALVVGLSDGS